jgi:hypothetical protein
LNGSEVTIRLDPSRSRKLLYRRSSCEAACEHAGAGRAILADDMGLGKTVQGIGTAELLARLAGIERVLVICPASVKSQWRMEIERFTGRECRLVLGSAAWARPSSSTTATGW